MRRSRLRAAAVIGGALAFAPAARANEKEVCASAAERGQSLRSSGRLVETRAQFIACSRRDCPPVIQEDCFRWLGEVERQLPTVVFRAVDSRDRDVVAVRTEVDGQLAAEQLDGHAIPLDPGPRKLRFVARAGRAVEQLLVVAEGEKARVVVVRFDAPLTPDGLPDGEGAAAPTPVPAPSTAQRGERTSPVPASVYVTGGLALGGLVAFGGFELWGQSQYRSLRDGCGRTTSCSEDDVSPARTKFIAAGVGLGVAVVAAAVTAVLLVTRGEPAKQAARAPALVHF